MIKSYFDEGREAYHKGNPYCPYPEGSEAYRSWDRGYHHEWFENYNMKEI